MHDDAPMRACPIRSAHPSRTAFVGPRADTRFKPMGGRADGCVMAHSGTTPVPSLPGPKGPDQRRPKGKWTIGLIGRRKSVRVAAIRDALRGEDAVGSFTVVATAGLKRTSNTAFGDHAIALVTARRLVVVVVNYQPHVVLNPVVLLATVIAHWISPVPRPYVLLRPPFPRWRRATVIRRRART